MSTFPILPILAIIQEVCIALRRDGTKLQQWTTPHSDMDLCCRVGIVIALVALLVVAIYDLISRFNSSFLSKPYGAVFTASFFVFDGSCVIL